MSLKALLKSKGPNGFGFGSTAEEVSTDIDLSGTTYLLTGCNSGLGLETMRVISKRGGHILAVARTLEKAQQAIGQTNADATAVACELSEPSSVLRCVEDVKALGKPLDAILCNAGIMALPKLHQKHGLELQFLTNHIGHFILVTQLLETLSKQGRVVITSSSAHNFAPKEGIQFDNLSGDKGYQAWKAYGQSKLANLLFAKHLAKRLRFGSQTSNALHPGVIPTNLGRHMSPAVRAGLLLGKPFFLKTIPQGAATQVYLAVHPQAVNANGAYFADCNPAAASRHAEDSGLAEKLWNVSEQIAARLIN